MREEGGRKEVGGRGYEDGVTLDSYSGHRILIRTNIGHEDKLSVHI
jgi:hypothetical protein